ncbi:hypothetical protein PUN28_020674 [Cardiocondyla obscurior]|uniref:Uncharacterized protein n=1 Tax=Cardiocondyla obscurior TaxID=286306 RepID=A0AAW2E5L7_9HYME
MSALPIIAKPYPLVKGGNDISRSLVSRKAQNNVTLLGGRSSDRSSHEPGLPYGAYAPQRARESNTRLGDFATPPADSSESSRKQHEARGLCHSAGRQLRELEKATRGSGTLPLRRPTAQRHKSRKFILPQYKNSDTSKKHYGER